MNPEVVMASSDFTIDKTAPTIDAGTNIVTNSSTALSPGLGDAVSSVWSGPAQVTFGDVNLATSTASAKADGAYAITLTTYDAGGKPSVDSLVFTWDTTPATVDVGSDITIGSAIAVNATVTGGATSYAWTKQSGTGVITFGTPTAEDTTISADTDSPYVIRLTAQDAAGNPAWDELNFTWNTSVVLVNVGSDLSIKTSGEAAISPVVSG